MSEHPSASKSSPSAVSREAETAPAQAETRGKGSVVFVDRRGLESVNQRQPLGAYVRSLWVNRHFILLQARSSAFTEGQGNFLGKLWLILDPVFQILIYTVVFGLILNTNRGIENFLGFLTLGVVYFRFLSKGITNGSGLVQKNRGVIDSFHFPRASVPIGTSVRAFFENSIPALVAVVGAFIFQGGHGFSWALTALPVLFVLMHVWGAGATMIVARLTAFLPDAKNFIRVFVQGLFFISGIFFSIDRFNSHPLLADIMTLNPLYQFLSSVRAPVLDGLFPSPWQWVYLTCWSVGIFVIGLIYFWQAEGAYSRVR
ncbi:ABC transporter permease [Corynebacterium mayonis]|uniref:ABC transporter permease n=1 Tax=Corynebacterium mayonis TaxID=3062461 RepID=UPI0031403745